MRSFILTIAALAAMAAPAYAQSSFAGANAGANSSSGSTASGGAAGAVLNFSTSTVDSNNIPGTQTIHNDTQAPDVVISGANACGLPMGASTSVLGFGFGVGATPTDKGCEHRDDAAAMHALGHDDVALGILCEQKDVSDAMAATGHQCPPVNGGSGQPIAQNQPLPTGDINTNLNNVVAVTPPPTPVADYVSSHAAWCKTLNPDNPRDVPYIAWDCRTGQ